MSRRKPQAPKPQRATQPTPSKNLSLSELWKRFPDGMLTDAEIERLRRNRNELIAFGRKAFNLKSR